MGRPDWNSEHERTQDTPTGIEYVRGDLFGTLGIPLLRGRLITNHDNEPNAPPVAVLNETLARTLFADADPIGRRVTLRSLEWQVVGMSDGCRLAAVGLGAGLVAAALGARLIASLLFGVSAYDPLVYASVAVILAFITFVSCWFPARRAANADPVQALRAE